MASGGNSLRPTVSKIKDCDRERDFCCLLQEISLAEDESRQKVFQNSLIWETVSKYLPMGDLKCLRLTNSLLCHQITNTTAFKEKVIVHITNDAMENEDIKYFLSKYPQWNSFAITLEWKEDYVDSFAKLHPFILASELKHFKLFWKNKKNKKDWFAEAAALLYGLLSNAPHLKKLEIEHELLVEVDISEANEHITSIMENVSDFRIFNSTSDRHKNMLYKYSNNLKFFGNLLFRLKSVSFDGTDLWNEEDADFMISIITINQSTLESLTLQFPQIWNRNDWRDIVCPQMKQLNVRLQGDLDNWKIFLKNQPPLNEIVVSTSFQLDTEVFSIVEEKHVGNLQKFHIKAAGLKISDTKLENRRPPLKFLKSTKLIDFSLVVFQGEHYTCYFGKEDCQSIVTEILPPTVRKLKLRGLAVNNLLRCGHFNFNDLIELSIIHFDYTYKPENDDIGLFEEIITKREHDGKFPFPNLRVLELHGCSEISGIGLKNLNDLKGLQKLRITMADLRDEDLRAISLPELQSLDISGIYFNRVAVMKQMVRQNPSLERLRCSQSDLKKEGRLKDIIVHNVEAAACDSDSECTSDGNNQTAGGLFPFRPPPLHNYVDNYSNYYSPHRLHLQTYGASKVYKCVYCDYDEDGYCPVTNTWHCETS